MTRRINTGVGDVETVTTTITGTADLSGKTFMVAFGSWDLPGSWRTPDAVSALSNGNTTVTLSMIVGQGHYDPVADTYWVWRQVVGGDVSRDPLVRYQIDTDTGTSIGDANLYYLPADAPLSIVRDPTTGLISSVTQNGVTTTYTRDGSGKIATQTRAGVTRTYTRDASGNLTGVA